MVALTEVRASNVLIPTTFPKGLVAVFVGGTSGIGEYTLKAFAKYTNKPRVYFIGRSQEAGDRITGELKALNAEGEYIFVKTDTSLIKNVDEACEGIKSKEKVLNLLFLTTGSLVFDQKTSEGLNYAVSLFLHCRTRLIQHFLPLLNAGPLNSLRRVVSVFTATKEGTIVKTPEGLPDLDGLKIPFTAARGHGASLVTLSLERFASNNPKVSFVHAFPGPVRSGITRGTTGVVMGIMKAAFAVLGPLVYIPNEECGERHLYLATSERYRPRDYKGIAGVPSSKGIGVARGLYGTDGGGWYSIDEKGEGADKKVEKLMTGYIQEGMRESIWDAMEKDFVRITGKKDPN